MDYYYHFCVEKGFGTLQNNFKGKVRKVWVDNHLENRLMRDDSFSEMSFVFLYICVDLEVNNH